MEGKLKKSVTVFINPDKKIKPNKLFEDVQMVFHPIQKYYEIRVLLWKNRRDFIDSYKKRSLIFTTPDEIEAKRSFELLKKMYYGK